MGKQIATVGAASTRLLPPRLAALASAVGTVRHPGQPERHHLQTGWVMSDMERREAVSLLSSLNSDLDPTASFEGTDGPSAKAMLLTKLIRGLAGAAEQSEVVAAAKIDMYADAVEDVPAWAIDKASKRWARGSCPADIEESPKYAFPPAPATLRKLALLELELPRRYVGMLSRLVEAIPMERALDPEPMPASKSGMPAMRRMG